MLSQPTKVRDIFIVLPDPPLTTSPIPIDILATHTLPHEPPPTIIPVSLPNNTATSTTYLSTSLISLPSPQSHILTNYRAANPRIPSNHSQLYITAPRLTLARVPIIQTSQTAVSKATGRRVYIITGVITAPDGCTIRGTVTGDDHAASVSKEVLAGPRVLAVQLMEVRLQGAGEKGVDLCLVEPTAGHVLDVSEMDLDFEKELRVRIDGNNRHQIDMESASTT